MTEFLVRSDELAPDGTRDVKVRVLPSQALLHVRLLPPHTSDDDLRAHVELKAAAGHVPRAPSS